MMLTDPQQTSAFLWAFVFGVIIAVIYTLLISIRSSFDMPVYTVVLTDTIFSVSVCAANFIYALAFTDSAVRLYVILSQTAGFLLFYLLVGRFIKRFCVYIVGIISEKILKIRRRIWNLIFSTVRTQHLKKKL